MVRYSGTLHKLAEAGPQKRGNWNLLLSYLEGYAVQDRSAANPKFDSPLPPYTKASADLQKELLAGEGPKREDTPLRIAVQAAPSNVVAALCHLGPEATRMADKKGRLPLHLACRRSSSDDEDTDIVLKILVQAYPQGLIHRDDGGRTPLHYLLWHHAPSRKAKLIEFFAQSLPESYFVGIKQPPRAKTETMPLPEIPAPCPENRIPFSAAIVHDQMHGALPIHYAAAEGASKEVVIALLTIYPFSRGLSDRKGRTPLAWYLGAGALMGVHVSGQTPDASAPPIWERRLSNSIVQLLLSSRVARSTDDTGRYPLHWAMHLMARYYYDAKSEGKSNPCLAIASVQLLLDNHVEALVTPDVRGMTPLHVLFDAVAIQQEIEWQRICRSKAFRDDVNLTVGGSKFRRPFAPPTPLVELLLRPPDCNVTMLAVGERPTCAAYVEDKQGRLPLHLALQVASDASVVRPLIQSHPTSLLHTTEVQLQSPLHMALSSPYSASLQTLDTMKLLMQAYVTSRHGTFVDGRLALKLEDAFGQYPLHFACENQASLEVTRLLFMSYPKAGTFQNALGSFPFHSLLDANLFGSSKKKCLTVGATLATPMGWTSEVEDAFRAEQLNFLQKKMSMLIEPLCQDENAMRTASPTHGMLPLHIAVAFDALPYASLYRMLNTYPEATTAFTTARGHAYSPMDLHEMRRPAAKDEENWHMIRELLFSFGPTLHAHRRQDELLDRCARVIRDELEGIGSSHATALYEAQNSQAANLRLTETLSSIEVPKFDHGGRPQTPKEPITPKAVKTPTRKKKAIAVMSPANKKKFNSFMKKSIYDDDIDTSYVVSPTASVEDDDYFSDEQSKEEEYISDEYDSRYDDDSFFDDDDKVKLSRKISPEDSVEKSRTEANKTGKQRKVQPSLEEATLSLTSQHDSSPESKRDVVMPFLSDVAHRLWVFFTLFTDPLDPDDHYAKQVDFVLNHLKYNTVQKLLMLPLPEYSSAYSVEGADLKGLTVPDVANANCKAIFHMACYFVGRFEFRSSQSDSILIKKSIDGGTVMIRAIEHIPSTFETTDNVNPGDVEAAIWATGEEPATPPTKRAFRVVKRSVCFTFMRSKEAYSSEVNCRKVMGVPVEDEGSCTTNIVPLVNHFNALRCTRPADERFSHDIKDERFQRLKLALDGPEDDEENSIFLPDYPFAIVTPFSDDGDLSDHLFCRGALGVDKIRKIGLHIGQSLRSMHEKGLVHGNVSLRNIVEVPVQDEVTSGSSRYWALSDLSCATRQTSRVSYMAGISEKGHVHFSTSSFPPEMFVSLTPGELNMFNDYWEAVESSYNVKIDKSVIAPKYDRVTGYAHVLRCYFAHEDTTLPPLPYKLLPTQESADLWSFGRVLFTLCSSGHPLFPINMRTGHLIDYDQVATWDQQKREILIYGHVDDPLAQDLLFQVLSSHSDRAALTMEQVLCHPFFTATKESGEDEIAYRVVDKRTSESIDRSRLAVQEAMLRSEEVWLKARTTSLVCWDLDFQMRFHLSPSEFAIRELSGGFRVSTIPYSIIALPYKLARNRAGKLTPSTKSDVELAERMGAQLLALSKACRFASCLEGIVRQAEPSHNWSLSKIADSIMLDKEDFKELHYELVTLASDKVEVFRDNPLSVSRRIVQERISELQCFFEDAGRAFLYFVDEYDGVPIIGKTGSLIYPLEVTEKVTELVGRALPFMYLCTLYTRGVAGDVNGLVKLIFEAAYPHIPPSWSESAKGLKHALVEADMKEELRILRDAIANLYPGRGSREVDDMRYFEAYFDRVDVKRTYANLQRVSNAGASIWTCQRGVDELKEFAKSHDQAAAYKAKIETDQKLLNQARKIAKLEEDLESLKFRREHNLQDYPMSHTNGNSA